MKWPSDLIPATLQRRYKRFLADVVLADGSEVTVHCPNTGAMTGCAEPGSRVWLSQSDNPKRKYPYTWQLVEVDDQPVCIHSALANNLVGEALGSSGLTELAHYRSFRREVKTETGSRIDFLLRSEGLPDCHMEVKSVTLLDAEGCGRFPDAASSRALRHVDELRGWAEAGQSAVLFFAVLHRGIDRVKAAGAIDPAYRDALARAEAAGVKLIAYRAEITTSEMRLSHSLPVSVD